MNSDTTIRIRIDPICSSSPATQKATSPPAAANSPRANGVRWLSGRMTVTGPRVCGPVTGCAGHPPGPDGRVAHDCV